MTILDDPAEAAIHRLGGGWVLATEGEIVQPDWQFLCFTWEQGDAWVSITEGIVNRMAIGSAISASGVGLYRRPVKLLPDEG